ncbi:MAG TPA: hypothetical protein VF331_17570, partial [Polyangiales bacterium]
MSQAAPEVYERPSELTLQLLLRGIAPLRRLTNPWFEGLEHVPDERPLLFVGNHTLFDIIDVPLLFAKLYVEKGIFLRALDDEADLGERPANARSCARDSDHFALETRP